MDLDTSPDNRTVRPTEAQMALLQALVEEPTLTAAAHRIGYSPRHARRLAQQLTTTMGVDTIRQAIAIAAAEGWIKQHPDRGSAPTDVPIRNR